MPSANHWGYSPSIFEMNACLSSLWRDVALFHQKVNKPVGSRGIEISLLSNDFSCGCRIQVPFLLGGRRHPASHRLLDVFHPISIVVPSPPSIPRDSAKNCLQLQYNQNIHCCHGDRFYPPLCTADALRHPHYYYAAVKTICMLYS